MRCDSNLKNQTRPSGGPYLTVRRTGWQGPPRASRVSLSLALATRSSADGDAPGAAGVTRVTPRRPITHYEFNVVGPKLAQQIGP